MIRGMNMFVTQILPKAIVRQLTEEEMAYYRQPFKKWAHRKPVWRWPNEIPIDGKPADVAQIVNDYNRKLRDSELPKLLFFAKPGGLITSAMVEWCKTNLQNLKTVDIGPGIHFLQEDNPHLIGSELVNWYQSL